MAGNDEHDLELIEALTVQLGAELRGRRLEAGLLQSALAARINYDRSYLSQVESGRQVPPSSSSSSATGSGPLAAGSWACSST
jgi:hypothetical protein